MLIWFSRRLVVLVLAAVLGAVAALSAASPWRDTAVSTTGADGAPAPIDLAAIWDRHLRQEGVPGGAFAIVSSTGTVQRVVRGEDGAGAAWAADTPALWGSVAKPVTAALARSLAEGGALDLEDRIPVVLPGCSASAPTYADLVHHTSGIGGALPALDRDSDASALATATAHADDLCPTQSRTYRYSSANYLLLAAALEAATGQDLAPLVERHVAAPTGAALVTSGDADVPSGHRIVAGQAVAMATPYDRAGVAYGYLGGSVRDLELVARGFLGDDPALGSPTADDGVPASSGERYGAGWRLRHLPDGSTMAWHSGMVPGYVTTVMLWPERDLGLVTLQNVCDLWQASDLLAGPWEVAAALGTAVTVPARESSFVYPLALGIATFATVLAWSAALRALAGRGGRRWMWFLATATTLGVVLAVPMAGVPWRQVWLWAPDLAVLLGALGIATVVGLAGMLLRRGSQTDQPAPSVSTSTGTAPIAS